MDSCCPVCSKTFETKAALSFHTKWQICRFKCPFCTRTFEAKTSVDDHVKKGHEYEMLQKKSCDPQDETQNYEMSDKILVKPKEKLEAKPPDQTSELSDDWKEHPSLPPGWKCITRIINGKMKEYFLDPKSGIFPSIDSAVRFMTKNSKYSSEDIERIKNRRKAPSRLPQIDLSLSSFNEKIFETNTKNANQKIDFKSQEWIEDNPYVPPGWKIRKTKSELSEAARSHFLTRSAARPAGERKEIFLSPNGKMLFGRKAVLDHMIEDGGYTAQDMDTVERGTVKRLVKWVRDSPTVPPGWKTRLLKGREMFESPSGEMFLGRVAVLDHLVAGGASSEEIFTVEKGFTGWEILWVQEKELPFGWRVRPISGLTQSETNSFYMSPAGQVFVGIDAARRHISEGLKEENMLEPLVIINEHIDDKSANMEIMYQEMEQNVHHTGGETCLTRNDSVEADTDAEQHIHDMSSQSYRDQASALLKLISSSKKRRNSLANKHEDDIVASTENQSNTKFSTNSQGDIDDEKNISAIQLEILKMAYKQWPHPIDEVVQQLMLETGLDEKYVKFWFWNRTWTKIKLAKMKAKSLKKESPDPNLENMRNSNFLTDSKKELLIEAPTLKTDKKTRAVLVLKSAFKVNPNIPNQERLVWIKRETGMKISAIIRWFENRRRNMKMKARRKSETSFTGSTEIEWI